MEQEVYRKFFELERHNWWFTGMRSIYDRQIRKLSLSASPQHILDVGCGTGVWTEQLGRLGRVVGIDYSPEALAFCQTRKLSPLLQASACDIPLRSNAFTMVTAFGVIEHVEDDQKALSEFYRVCCPGGFVFLLTSAYRFLWSYHDDFVHHKRRYLRSELSDRVREAGFEIRRISYVNAILFPGIAAIRLLQRISIFHPDRAEEVTDIFDVKGILNRFLRFVLEMEAFLLQFTSFPFGVGLLCVARKPEGGK